LKASEPGHLRLGYERGSLLLSGASAAAPPVAQWPPYMVWDERVAAWRCLALHYRALVHWLTREGWTFDDRARAYPELPAAPAPPLPAPYPHQSEALEAWSRGKRGIVELPTGSGKTQLALRAIAEVGRGALVLVPTLELLAQWCGVIERGLGLPAGAIGGGQDDLQALTVCTYASAYRRGEQFGDRFCLAVFDECHHMAGQGYARIGEVLLAPYRLGLSATLERLDEGERVLEQLIGPLVYRRSITELSGDVLADYRVETLHAELSDAEREAHDAARERYRAFARERGLTPTSARAWQRFVFVASASAEGRAALDAYRQQRRIAYAPESKFALLARLLRRHRGERLLVFTNDNRTAYEVSRRFLLPVITHQTRTPERRAILARFRDARWPALVTSRVLNEGVDVPEANVAVILSGTSSVREHVQRLGRILRKAPGKEAVLYEVLSRTTGETFVSQRRRQHDAYR
jgi:superfamily II DNA or RNA helicase